MANADLIGAAGRVAVAPAQAISRIATRPWASEYSARLVGAFASDRCSGSRVYGVEPSMCHVLVIEDEQPIAGHVGDLAERADASMIDRASTPAEAIGAVRRFAPAQP